MQSKMLTSPFVSCGWVHPIPHQHRTKLESAAMACFYGLRKLGARMFWICSSCWNFGLKASLEIERVDFYKYINISIDCPFQWFCVFQGHFYSAISEVCRTCLPFKGFRIEKLCPEGALVRFTWDASMPWGNPCVKTLLVLLVCICNYVHCGWSASICRSCWGWWWFATLGFLIPAGKLTWNPKIRGLQDDFPFSKGQFSRSMLVLRGAHVFTIDRISQILSSQGDSHYLVC